MKLLLAPLLSSVFVFASAYSSNCSKSSKSPNPKATKASKSAADGADCAWPLNTNLCPEIQPRAYLVFNECPINAADGTDIGAYDFLDVSGVIRMDSVDSTTQFQGYFTIPYYGKNSAFLLKDEGVVNTDGYDFSAAACEPL